MYQYNRKGPKRGVALYSYSAEYGISKIWKTVWKICMTWELTA